MYNDNAWIMDNSISIKNLFYIRIRKRNEIMAKTRNLWI